MQTLTKKVDANAAELGIEVVDVRVKKIDLPPEVSESVYQRMRAERERVARDLRAKGAEAAERIRADADRQRTVTLAEAYKESEQLRGEGDAKAAEIYADAFNQNEDFFSFHRSLNAYRTAFGEGGKHDGSAARVGLLPLLQGARRECCGAQSSGAGRRACFFACACVRCGPGTAAAGSGARRADTGGFGTGSRSAGRARRGTGSCSAAFLYQIPEADRRSAA